MQTEFNNISDKLGDWIKATPLEQGNDQLILTLALIRVYQLDIGYWDDELKKKTLALITPIKKLDFSKSDLTIALLACDLALELGNEHLVQNALFYLSILKDYTAQNEASRNSILLKAAFRSFPATEKQHLQLQIPLDKKDVNGMILKVLDKIEKQTFFGNVGCSASDFNIIQLESMAIHAQRSYDFPLAMRCLRVRNYLSSANSLMMKTSLNFIKFEQNQDGSFADYQSDFQSVENKKERNTLLLKIKTVIAIEVIWTLFEWKGNNLISSLAHLKIDEKINELNPI